MPVEGHIIQLKCSSALVKLLIGSDMLSPFWLQHRPPDLESDPPDPDPYTPDADSSYLDLPDPDTDERISIPLISQNYHGKFG